MNTPRTDALEDELHDKLGHGSYEMALPFCRQLETQVQELREALERINAEVGYTASPDDWPKLHNVGLIARAILEKTK